MTINVGKIAMVSAADIEVGKRVREEMGDLDGLEVNMKRSGLIAPLAVKEHDQCEKYYLLAGARRLGILIKNKIKTIPVRIYPADITKTEVRSIELSENFHRKDFEHWEHDNLIRDIHKTQQEIHGEKISTLADADGWGMKDTGDMIGKSKGHVSTSIRRAEAREVFPELFDKCKTKKDASNVLKKLDEEIVREVLAKKIEAKQVDVDKQQLMNSFVLKDFFKGIEEAPDDYFNLVEIDPPYAIELQKAKKSDGVSMYNPDDYNEVGDIYYRAFLFDLFKKCYRKMAEHSWLICWFAPEPWFGDVYELLHEAGFSCHRMCGIWTKKTGQSKRPEIHLANSYEMFFYAWKGRPALARPGRSNIFDFSPVPAQHKVHPTERPVELTSEIYSTFAWPGSRVAIPFLGSGNGLLSAKELGMTAIGWELTKAYRDSFLVKVYKM